MATPEDQVDGPIDSMEMEQRLKRYRFTSTKDTISETLMIALRASDMVEKVNACHAFIALGLNELAITADSSGIEAVYIGKIVTWQRHYKHPRLRATISQDADKNTVMVIEDEGESKAKWVVPPAMAIMYQKLALDSMLLQKYQTELLPLVSEMVGKLTHYGILRERSLEFKPTLDFLLDQPQDEEEEYDDDEEH